MHLFHVINANKKIDLLLLQSLLHIQHAKTASVSHPQVNYLDHNLNLMAMHQLVWLSYLGQHLTRKQWCQPILQSVKKDSLKQYTVLSRQSI